MMWLTMLSILSCFMFFIAGVSSTVAYFAYNATHRKEKDPCVNMMPLVDEKYRHSNPFMGRVRMEILRTYEKRQIITVSRLSESLGEDRYLVLAAVLELEKKGYIFKAGRYQELRDGRNRSVTVYGLNPAQIAE